MKRVLLGAVTCECAPSCWCHKPVLSAFRWVFPLGHTGGLKLLVAEQ